MRLKLFCLLFVMALAGGVSAQTATPTPCNPGVDIGNLNMGGNCQSNSIDSEVRSDIYRVMATAAANVNALPEQIRNSGSDGESSIPSTAGAIQIFGYLKWLFSPNTAQELLGKSLAPFGINVFVIFLFVVTLTGIYLLVNLVVLVIKAVSWIINQFLKLIPFW